MRQFAGFGTPEETNGRYKHLLAAGGTGLSVAFDLPTLMGRDPDHPLSLGEVGKCGVSVASLADMERLFDGISLGDITTSMTINSPAPMIFAMYLVVAEQQGADWKTLSGTIQNDILKEFIAQKEYIFPPRPSMRLITDIFEFCAKEVPKWNTISVSGYHIREAGATALQELAFTLRDGIEYVQWGVDAGLDVDDFVPRMSFFFNAHSDFFEEIAKYRAARKIWARVMRERFGAKRRALAGSCASTRRRPACRSPRSSPTTTSCARRCRRSSAVLGGTNSLHTNSLDEALALPTAEAATLALRTQQVIAHESGVAERRRSARRVLLRRAADARHGGRAPTSTSTRSIAWAAWSRPSSRATRSARSPSRRTGSSRPSRRKEKLIVGVNALRRGGRAADPILYIDDAAAEAQLARLDDGQARAAIAARVARALAALREAARGTGNTMYPLLECVRAYATVGEMCDALREVWGEYEEVAVDLVTASV